MAHGGRIVFDKDGKEIARHRIDPHGGGTHTVEAIKAAHGYDLAPGRRFNLMHGSKALPPAAREQLAVMSEDERNAVLDLSDHRDHAPILARLRELKTPAPAEAAAPKKETK